MGTNATKAGRISAETFDGFSRFDSLEVPSFGYIDEPVWFTARREVGLLLSI